MSFEASNENELNAIRSHLRELQMEHRDLDQIITHLAKAPPADEPLIRRLKKRKLGIKDKIMQIERELTPDIPA